MIPGDGDQRWSGGDSPGVGQGDGQPYGGHVGEWVVRVVGKVIVVDVVVFVKVVVVVVGVVIVVVVVVVIVVLVGGGGAA